MPPTSITIPLPRRPAVWLAIGLAAGLVVAAIASPAFAPRPIAGADPTTPPEHTISVTGTGKVVVTPDIADLRLGVSVTKPTVKAARAAAAEIDDQASSRPSRSWASPTRTSRPRTCRCSPSTRTRPTAARPS